MASQSSANGNSAMVEPRLYFYTMKATGWVTLEDGSEYSFAVDDKLRVYNGTTLAASDPVPRDTDGIALVLGDNFVNWNLVSSVLITKTFRTGLDEQSRELVLEAIPPNSYPDLAAHPSADLIHFSGVNIGSMPNSRAPNRAYTCVAADFIWTTVPDPNGYTWDIMETMLTSFLDYLAAVLRHSPKRGTWVKSAILQFTY